MTKKHIFIILGGVLISLVVAAYFFGGKRELPEVITTTAELNTIVERVSASGKIQPELEVSVSAEVSGQLIELPVKEGDVVAEGDLLAVINPDVYISARTELKQSSPHTPLANVSQPKRCLHQVSLDISWLRNHGIEIKSCFKAELCLKQNLINQNPHLMQPKLT